MYNKGGPKDLEVGLGGYNASADHHDIAAVPPHLPEDIGVSLDITGGGFVPAAEDMSNGVQDAPDDLEVGLVISNERRRSSWRVRWLIVWSCAMLRKVKSDKDEMSMRSKADEQRVSVNSINLVDMSVFRLQNFL